MCSKWWGHSICDDGRSVLPHDRHSIAKILVCCDGGDDRQGRMGGCGGEKNQFYMYRGDAFELLRRAKTTCWVVATAMMIQ